MLAQIKMKATEDSKPREKVRPPQPRNRSLPRLRGTLLFAQPIPEAYDSSKEKLLISKIITLKKQQNELCLTFKRRTQLLQEKLERSRGDSQTLRTVLRQFLPLLQSHLERPVLAQLRHLLERDRYQNGAQETGTQCSFVEAEGLTSNKESTNSQSVDDAAILARVRGDSPSRLDERKKDKVEAENECYRKYVGYMMGREKTDENKKSSAADMLPTFVKSMWLSS